MLFRRLSLAIALAIFLAACGGGDDAATAAAADEMADETMTDDDSMEEMSEEHMPTTFTVTITTNEAAALPTPLAPGTYLVHTSMDTLFVENQVDRGEGLEALAEDGDPSGLVTSLSSVATVSTAGAFTNPDGGDEAGPALP